MEGQASKVVKSWEEDLDVLLTCLKYPSSIQRMIYTTNIIERIIKEIKKRTKTMNSLPSEKAAEKVVSFNPPITTKGGPNGN